MYNGTVLFIILFDSTIILKEYWISSYLLFLAFLVIYLVMYLLKVGDPKQLPATVMSGLASKFLYECSMFERLQRAGYPVIMLTKQVICYYCYHILQFCCNVDRG